MRVRAISGSPLAAWDGALDKINTAFQIGESGGFGAREPAYPLGPRFAGPRQGLARDSAPSIPPEARAPAEFAGGGLAPRPSCRCVLSRAPHEGHMAAGSCWGRLRGRGLGEATRASAKSMGNSPRTHEQSLRSEQPYRLTVENQAMLIPKRWPRSGRTAPTRRMSISVGTIPQSLSSRYFKPSIIDQGLMRLISVSFIMGNGCTS